MRDHVNAERISAYLDGELSDDERELVEQQLAESEEHRHLLEELEGVRADLQAQARPTFSAPADLQSRIMAQIEESKAPPMPVASGASRFVKWQAFAAIAASLAVLAIAAVIVLDPSLATRAPEVPAYLKDTPNLTLVYDVTLTDAGQENKTFEKIVKQLGVGLDPTMKMDGGLERDLVEIRQLGNTNQTELVPFKTQEKDKAKEPKAKGDDGSVEMIYISSTNGVFDQLYMKLQEEKKTGQSVSKLKLALIQEDRQLEVMRRLRATAKDHFVQSTPHGPTEVGYGFRLVFRMRLNSSSVPGVASFSLPGLEAMLEQQIPDIDASSQPKSPPAAAKQTQVQKKKAAPKPVPADNEEKLDPADQPTHVLIILRKPGA